MYAIVKDGQCPNAVDALKICWYLGVSVDEIFGDNAEEELLQAQTDDPVRRPVKNSESNELRQRLRQPPDHSPHAETALKQALEEKRAANAKIRRIRSKKSTGKKRTG